MTGEPRFCPQCGTRRTGFFRFCSECGFDFDELLGIAGRAPAGPPIAAPTHSDVARPTPILPGTAPPRPQPVPATPPPAPPQPPAPVWPPQGAAPPEALEPTTPRPTLSPRFSLEAVREQRPETPEPASAPVARESGGRASTILARRPDLTLTRIAIVALAALLGFSAISNLLKTSSAGLLRTPLPTTELGSPLVVDSPGIDPSAGPGASFGPTGEMTIGIVKSVVDGDTIRVDIDGQETRVRYIGVDSPEPDATDPAIKQLADSATAANNRLVEGMGVYLERDVSDTDQFGRLLRDVWLLDSGGSYILVSLELVRLGYAQVTTLPPDVKYVEELTAAQQAAKADQLGLWRPAESAAPAPSSPAAEAPQATVQTLVGGTRQCHASYTPCLPIVADLDCPDVREMGAAPVTVKGPDDYRLDAEGDGIGCE